MYMLNGWWFLSSSGSYPPVFTVDTCTVCGHPTMSNYFTMYSYKIRYLAPPAKLAIFAEFSLSENAHSS